MSDKKIIDSLGGYKAVAEMLGLHPTTVFKWHATSRIPSSRWLEIERLAKKLKVQGIDLDAIVAGHRRRQSK